MATVRMKATSAPRTTGSLLNTGVLLPNVRAQPPPPENDSQHAPDKSDGATAAQAAGVTERKLHAFMPRQRAVAVGCSDLLGHVFNIVSIFTNLSAVFVEGKVTLASGTP